MSHWELVHCRCPGGSQCNTCPAGCHCIALVPLAVSSSGMSHWELLLCTFPAGSWCFTGVLLGVGALDASCWDSVCFAHTFVVASALHTGPALLGVVLLMSCWDLVCHVMVWLGIRESCVLLGVVASCRALVHEEAVYHKRAAGSQLIGVSCWPSVSSGSWWITP